MTYQRMLMIVSLVCFFSLTVSAEFYPERIYKERSKTLLDNGWKFYQGTPSGTPSATVYNDGATGWQTVNIPHSASYDEPTGATELNHYHGDVWYRKTFTVPSVPHTGKMFIEFEGAMQSADVWLNGVKLGAHYASGYTWFSFDMTGKTQTSNVLAVKLNNDYTQQIPPGNVGSRTPYDASTFPDFHIFSGLYRDVWLVCTDKVYIPLYGQRITTPEVSVASAKVQVKTIVKNDDATSKDVTLSYVVTDSSNAIVLSESLTATIAAGQSYTFDKTSDALPTPKLWSTENPYLYKVFTRVVVDGQAVDDYVDRFGIRWFEYSLSEGFKLNGVKKFLKGVCLHQTFGWIENALPNTRFFEELKMVKDMGADEVRCSHYPRDPSFYNAADELGILLYVEVPSWGVNTTSYPQIFWDRLDTCVREMIEVGYNHPSIYLWGLFNEPAQNGSAQEFSAGITKANTTAHMLDSTRLTVMANTAATSVAAIPDVVGVNYWIDVAKANETKIRINTEFHPGWFAGYTCLRCAAKEPDFSTQRWGFWTEVRDAMDISTPTNHSYIGGNMWSFNDYSSVFLGAVETPMGVVDYYRLPKQAFYYFRNQWTGKATDYPSASVTATKIVLEPDITNLIADSTDISRLVIATRDGTGALANASLAVTLQIKGPVDVFGQATVSADRLTTTVTRTTLCGKIALVLKSRNTPGTISIKATGPNVAADSVTYTSAVRDESPLQFVSHVLFDRVARISQQIKFANRANSIAIILPSKVSDSKVDVTLLTIQGRQVACPAIRKNEVITLTTAALKAGYYCLQISNGNGEVYKKLSFVKIH
jgi:beta-galactosidase